MMTRLGLKRSREFENTGDENSSKKQKRIEEIKVEKTRKEEIKGEEEKEKEVAEKVISDRIQKEWTRKKAGIKSTEGKLEFKGVRWSKYTVMKRRTESLVDLAQRKGVFFRQEQGVRGLGGTKAKKQSIVQRPGRTRSRSEGGLLKELLTWNHRKAERDFMDHDGQYMQ